MASFAEIRAKMSKNYGDAEEEKKKQQEQRQQNGTVPANSKFAGIRSEMESKYKPTYSHVDESFINTFFSDAQSYLNSGQRSYEKMGWANKDSVYEAQKKTVDDLRSRSRDIRQYLEKNKSTLKEEDYTQYMSFLDSFDKSAMSIDHSFYSKNKHLSQFKNEDDYNFWETHNTVEKRQQRYEDNIKRIEELIAERKEVDPGIAHPAARMAAKNLHGDRLKEIDTEIAALEAENLKYKRGEGGWVAKVVDDNYHVTQREDFDITSANRDYKNPTPDEYAQIAAYNDQNSWYFDENGIYRDAYGNALEVDEFGNWINPKNKDMPIEDKLGMFLNASDEQRNQVAAGTWGINNITDTFREGLEGDWKYLSDQEVGIYYTYLGESQEKAYQYLKDMEVELDRRRTLDEIGQWYDKYDKANDLEKIAMSVATVPAQLISGVGGTISNAVDTMQGEEINPYSTAHRGMHYSQTVRGATAEGLKKISAEIPVWKEINDFFSLGDVYQAGMSILDSFSAIGIGGAVGGAILASSAAQSEAYRLYQQGASSSQIAFGSTAAFAAEMLFESISIGELNKIKNMASPKTFGQFVKTALVQGGVEASEEMLTEIANTVSNAFIMASQSDWNALMKENNGDLGKALLDKTLDVIHAGLSGFISGVGSGGIAGIGPYARQRSQLSQIGGTIKAADGGVKALQDLAMDVAGASEGKLQKSLTKQASKVGQKTSAAKVGYLYDTVQTANKVANTSANQADIAKSLQRNGFNAETANDLAAALVAQYNGQTLTKAQEKLLESAKDNSVVQKAISNIVTNDKSTMGQRQQNIRDFQEDMRVGTISKAFGISKDAAKEIVNAMYGSKDTTTKESTYKGNYEVSPEGKAEIGGNEVVLNGLRKNADGSVVVATADNQTADPGAVKYPSKGHALVYEGYANIEAVTDNPVLANMDVDTRSMLARAYDPAAGVSAEDYFLGSNLAFQYGFEGIPINEKAIPQSSPLSSITKEQRDLAYDLGQAQRKNDITRAQDKLTKRKEAFEKSGKAVKKGGVYFRNGTDVSDIDSYMKKDGRVLEDVQKVSIETMKNLSEALGIEFVVYESYVKDGKRYYIDENGVEQEGAPNGWYDQETGKIYIDLHAGNKGQGTMLFTIAHELTHFIHQWSPAKFAKLADIIFTHGNMKGKVAGLVAEKMRKAEARGNPISYKVAYEEVVADGMESILKSGRVVDMVADIKQQDRGLWQKICDWFKDLANYMKRVVDAYQGKDPDSIEGKMVAEMTDLIKEIEAIYTEGLADASENFQASEKNTTDDGGVRTSIREIIGESGTNYGKGVYLDSNKLSNIPEAQRKDVVIGLFRQLGGKKVVAYDQNGTAIEISIADSSRRYKNSRGKSIPVNNHITSFLNNTVKQEALILADEVIAASRFDEKEDAVHAHDWLDNDGKNQWDVWKVFLQEKNNSVWEATLKVANTTDGEKILYELYPIEKVEAAWKPGTSTTNNRVTQPDVIVKRESAEALDVEVDTKTESVAPTVLKSERTWTESDYVQEREQAAKEISKAIGVSVKKAKAYIDSVNSIAKMIAEDRVRLDYFSSPGRSSFVSNVEYGGSFDFSTLCKKRRLLTGTFTAIQKALPNTALTANEILDIRNRMKEKGLEVSCGLCYVEGSRANMGQFAKEFLKLYKQYYPDAWQPNMADVNTPDGIEWVRINHPECYEQYEYFWNHYGTLKPGDKNLFASQQKPKLYQLHTEYKGDILEKFSEDDDNVEDKNLNGGIRLQSFSDFEIVHLIDTMQIIMDMSRVGLAGQAYTKVPDFAWALGDTGLKINLSLIAKGVDENGRLIFDDVEGMPIDKAVELRNRYSKNVGTILVAFNDEQLLAAMADERVDFIIPFHRSQWKKSQYEAMGLPAKTKDYTYMQNEKYIKPQFHEYRGRMVKDKATNYMPNEYWDFNKSGKENAEAYLEMCARNNKRPKFYKLLQNNGDGSYSLKADGSTDGYWKLLIDFKMYDNSGKGSPQMPVKPDFNMYEATRMLDEYSGGHSNFPVAQGIVDDFVKEYKDSHKGVRYSERVAAAVEEFGTTTDFAQAGFIVGNGQMLKLSQYGQTGVKHKLIERVFDGVTGHAAVTQFLHDGNVRINANSPGIEIAKYADISVSQLNTISRFVSNSLRTKGMFYLDITDKNGDNVASLAYDDSYNTEDIIYDLKDYSDRGKIPTVRRYMFSDRDSDGNQLSTEQQEFFKDSKVRDKKGNLLIVYHGTTANFNIFKKGDVGFHFGTKGAARGRAGYGKNVNIKSVYLNITNPIVFDEDLGSWDADYRLTRELYDRGILTKDEAMSVLRTDDGRYKRSTEAANKKLASVLMEKGYDGIAYQNTFETKKATTSYIAFSSNQAKETSNLSPTSNPDIRFQEREEDSVSNRSLLANAFEGVAQNDIEKQKLQDYRGKIDLLNAEERKLNELNEQIKELSFAKGPRDTKKIRELQFEATQTANRISVYDKQLLRLEASKPLQNVLQREKKMAYKRAEQKGKEALAAYKEKTAKTQREMLEKWQDSRKKGIESRRKTAMRHKIKDIVNELNQYLLKGTKDRHVPIELQKAVAEALDAVNMDTVGAEERIAKLKDELLKAKTPEQIQEISRKIDHVQQMGDRMNGRLQKLKDAYDQFVNSDDPLIANSHDEVISNKLQSVIEDIGNTPLRDMTLAQLEDVYDMYRMVLTTIRNANKAFKAKKSESISTIANRVMMEVERVGGKKKLSMKATEGVKGFFWNNLKPVYAFNYIGSDAFTEVFNNVRDGEDVWAVDVSEAREYYLDKSKKHNYDSWDFDKRHNFTSTSGMDFSLNLEQIMSLYAYSKRDQAADHLKKGGIVIDETTEVTIKNKLGIPVKFNPTEATAYNISEETLADIVGQLTDEQKAFVDEMQDYLSTVMGAKGNEVSLEMYGIKLFKEKFYFPLKSAQQFMAKAKEQAQGEAKIKNSGFSKETVQKASNPIVLTPFMNVWANHVNEMSMYHAFVLPMEDFYRVYNYKTPTSETMATESVEMFIQNAYGKGATKYIDQLLKDLNGGARTDSTTGFINKMIGLFKKGAVFASLSVVIQQPSAIARAAALVDTKYFIGPKVDHKRHKALWDEVKQYAPVAIIKEMGYFDTSVGKSTQEFILGKEYSGFQDKIKAIVTDSNYRDEILSKAPALADEIAWCGIWEAVKRELMAKNPGADIKSEEFLKKAGERFTEVIVKTQVYDSVLSRSGFMRSKDTGMKMATAFMAEPTTSINMVADALQQGKRGNKKYARAAIGAVIASQILNSILVSFVYAGRDDDEDETYPEKYIGTLSGEILDSLNPAGYIPFIKDIVSIVQGYEVERSDMAVVSDLWNAWQNLSKDTVSTYRKVEGFAGSIAQIFGLPVKNIMRDARGIYQTVMSFVNGQHTTAAGIGYAVKGAITGKAVSDQQQLYDAYLSGDKTQITRVVGRFKDQNAINNAIRKGLRENDPRIREAAIAWNADDLGEYMRIAKEIIAEKHFVQDDVVMAIRSEASALAPDAETATTSKAKGLFTAENFAEAISQGKAPMADVIKKDIIKTAMQNGKTAEEAEKNFRSAATSGLKDLFLSGNVSESQAIDALETYCDKTKDEAMADVQYWAFKQEYPDVYADDQWFDTYYEKVADSGLDIEVYMEYRNTVSTITGEGKKEKRMAAIHNLPITSAQKDALYLAEGWAESKLYEAPWH